MSQPPSSPPLEALGWTDAWARSAELRQSPGQRPGRIAVQHKERYRLWDGQHDFEAVVSGRFRRQAESQGGFPVVGDWVCFEPPSMDGPVVIQAVLPRQNLFSRLSAGGGSGGQALASNLSTLFIAMSCNADWNVHRVERFLALARASQIRAVILLTKLDLIDDPRPLIQACVEHIGLDAPVFAVSARTGEGLEKLNPYLQRGQTVALVGSSGVGKSTLLNRLVEAPLMEVQPIRSKDDKGRHTTTHRQMFPLPGGAILIDSPGIREVGMYSAGEGIHSTFSDITELAGNCRFADCQHQQEPGCAVLAALASGEIQPDRLDHYRKLLRENEYQRLREDVRLQLKRKKEWRAIHRRQRDMYRDREKP